MHLIRVSQSSDFDMTLHNLLNSQSKSITCLQKTYLQRDCMWKQIYNTIQLAAKQQTQKQIISLQIGSC